MKYRLAGIALFLILLFPLLAVGESVLFQQGYVRVQGDVPVFIDAALKEEMGTIHDASVVYVTEANEEARVYSIAFGYNWVVRIGFIDARYVFPLTGIEQEAYLNLAQDGMMISDVHLLNVGFTLYSDGDAAGGSSQQDVTPLPTAAPTPLPTVAPWSSSKGGTDINVIMQPADQYGFNGETVVLAVGAENVKDYQWQYLNGGEWVDSVMSQANSAAMRLVVFPSEQARTYRCRMTGIYGDVVYSDTVSILEQ